MVRHFGARMMHKSEEDPSFPGRGFSPEPKCEAGPGQSVFCPFPRSDFGPRPSFGFRPSHFGLRGLAPPVLPDKCSRRPKPQRPCNEVQTLETHHLVRQSRLKTGQRRPLPAMHSLEEATTLSGQERDKFYLHAFALQEWIDQLVDQAAAEYSPRNQHRFHIMQTGQAQRAFLQTFGNTTVAEFADLLESLYRFTEYHFAPPQLLFRALLPLSIEHESSGDFMEPRAPDPSRRPREATALLRRSVERWCEWLDAVVHLRTHAGRRLAAGERWVSHELDQAVISLWPLLKRHHWTHGD